MNVLWRWALVALGVIALWVGGVLALNQTLYSPGAFVESYLDALADDDVGLAASMSGGADNVDVLPAVAPLSDIVVTGSQWMGPTELLVQASYVLDGEAASTVFTLERSDRALGLFDQWRFAVPPTAEISAGGVGIREYTINGHAVSSSAAHSVLTPGVYSIAAGNQWSASETLDQALTDPGETWQVELELQPTDALRDEVTQAVDEYLQECASREVLQPASCPFGTEVSDRLTGLPTWSITVLPELDFELASDGSYWRVAATAGVATVTGTIQSLFDGSLRPLNRDVPFSIYGEVTNLYQDSPAFRID